MNYHHMSKIDLKLLQKTKLGGTDGDLYLSPSKESLLKLLHNFSLYQGIGDKLKLLEKLLDFKELKDVAAIPEELIVIESLNRFGFWMKFYQSGVELDKWTKQNANDLEKVLQVYRRISEILKNLHTKYGIIVSDCYYKNILIVEDEYPIFVDVDSWSMGNLRGYTVSRILHDYALRNRWNRYDRELYLRYSEDADKAALWLMFLESVLNLPVRGLRITKFSEIIKKETNNPILLEVVKKISCPDLSEIPYLHETMKQYILRP